MAKSKYDRPKLKKKFFSSKFLDVKSFLNHVGVTYSAYSTRKTKGWAAEKNSLEQQAVSEAIENSKEKLAKKFEMSFDELLEMKYYGLQLAKKAMNQIGKKKGDICPKKVETLIKIIKTELGEPTNVTQASVENTHEIVNEDPCRSLLDKLREEEDGK